MKDTKKKILEGAFKLFLENNYEKVTVVEMEQVIGMTRGSIFYHMQSKEKLFFAVVDTFILKNQDIKNKIDIPDTITFAEFIDLYVGGVARMVDSMRNLVSDESKAFGAYWGLLYQAKKYYPNFDELISEKFFNDRKVIERIAGHAITNGEIRCDLSPEIVAKHFRFVFLGYSFEESLNKGLDIDVLKGLLISYYNLIKVT